MAIRRDPTGLAGDDVGQELDLYANFHLSMHQDLLLGYSKLFAGDFSGMVPEPSGTAAIATNPAYATLFSRLGWGSVVVGVA